MKDTKKIRNIALIAHVDHGKTTLVDAILNQTGTFSNHETAGNQAQIMDSNDLERERGITIFSKNASFDYKGNKVNIVDTPGHADFGGEVERILSMVDGVLLLVDAFEGPMPQTRFVLQKSLEEGLKVLVVINKIDRPNCRPMEVLDMVLDLFIELGATDEQMDFPYLFASGKAGFAMNELEDDGKDIVPLLDKIITEIPSPEVELEKPFQMQVNAIDYNDYLGRIAIGRINRGNISKNQQISVIRNDGKIQKFKIQKLFLFEKLGRTEAEEAFAGDICAISGIPDINIGETVSHADHPEALPTITVDEPTISMNFIVNTSPFAGKEGKFVTSRHLGERLQKELLSNLALKVEETDSTETFKVSGRGELHLSILIETMRREGYEFAVSSPEVIFRDVDGKLHEPIEELTCDIPDVYMGTVMEKLGKRKAEMIDMTNLSDTVIRIVFHVPTRGIIGYSGEFKTDTRGEGIMSHRLHEYQEYKGDIVRRKNGAIISMVKGNVVGYAVSNLDDRGIFFIKVGDPTYEGMIAGAHNRDNDIVVNLSKSKKLTNVRSSGTDDALKVTPPKIMSLEESLDWINNDELVEVTPKSIRLRKRVLNESDRKLWEKKQKM